MQADRQPSAAHGGSGSATNPENSEMAYRVFVWCMVCGRQIQFLRALWQRSSSSLLILGYCVIVPFLSPWCFEHLWMSGLTGDEGWGGTGMIIPWGTFAFGAVYVVRKETCLRLVLLALTTEFFSFSLLSSVARYGSRGDWRIPRFRG